VIDFVEKEKEGPIIPHSNTTARIVALLGCSERSVHYLKTEIKELRATASVTLVDQSEDESKPEATSIRTGSQSNAAALRKRKGRMVRRRSSVISSTDLTKASRLNPNEPLNEGNSGRPRLNLSEAAADVTRYHFHPILVRSSLMLTNEYLLFILRLRSDTQRLSNC
jgi:hypothetical protein